MLFEVQDLLSFLHDKYLLESEEYKKEAVDADVLEPSLDGFVAWAKTYLAEVNQPINVAYLAVGLGLRLQQGQTVGFQTQAEDYGMRDTGVPITRHSGFSHSNMIPAQSVEITGRR